MGQHRGAWAAARRAWSGCTIVLTMALAAIFLAATGANATVVNDDGTYRIATQDAFSQFQGGLNCDEPTCTDLSTNGGQVYTSDYLAVQTVLIYQQADGETIQFNAVKPDGSVLKILTLTYDLATDCWSWTGGGSLCNAGILKFWTGPGVNCQAPGTWALQVYDNSTLVISNPFSLHHNPSGLLGISLPTDDPLPQLFQLTQQDYTGSETVPFSAGNSEAGAISWAVDLQYATSGGYGSMPPDNRTFTTASGEEHDETYQSKGGQLKVTAQTTTSYGTMYDCVTVYVEGPEPGIPDATITGRLDTLYPASNSYPNDGTATPNLMTGIAMKESSYAQFLEPPQPPKNVDLWNLYADTNWQVAAKWPLESKLPTGLSDGGSHIGLMMFPTSPGDAWNWETNTFDGVRDASYGFAGADLPLANSISSQIMKGSQHNGIPAHTPLNAPTGLQLENVALVLYGPFAHSTVWTLQYYIPVCTGTITAKGNTWTCSGTAWYWAINDPTIDPNVQAKYIFPPGTPVTSFGNPDGIDYVNNPNDPNNPGVRDLLK